MTGGPGFRRLALLAGLLVMMSLGACGGSDSGSGSTQSTTAGGARSAAAAKPRPATKKTDSGSTSPSRPRKAAKELGKSNAGATSNGSLEPKQGPSKPAGSRREDASSPKGAGRCPNGVDAEVCSEVRKALKEGQKQSTAAAEGKCPPAIGAATCKAIAGGATEPQAIGEDTPTQCPPALSAAQCAELAKAYEEATK